MNRGTDIPLTPEEAYHASKMFGGSLFSAIQLTKELEKIRAAQSASREPHDDVLRIPIPRELMQTPKMGSEMDEEPGVIGRALRLNRHPVRMLVGSQAGFGDAQREFHEHEKAQIAKELQHAQREYIATLQQIKTGEETPYVDAFCEGMAQDAIFGKEAADTAADVSISDHSIRRLLGDAFNIAKKPLQPAVDTATSGMMSAGTSAAYLTYLLRKKQREEPEAYMREELPTKVELVPYN